MARAVLFFLLFTMTPARASEVDEDQPGAWYMLFFSSRFDDSRWGIQGDVQYRNWDLIGDLEQLLLRGGVTYTPAGTNVLLTLGYGHITSGEFGDGDETRTESRIYQEALLPHAPAARVLLRHRFRYEQRWVEGQDFRTRYRYALFMDVPLNQDSMSQGVWYLALYNELFINGQRDIGNQRQVEWFDRNRFYAGIGHGITDRSRIQFGIMNQTSDSIGKNQLQFSLHHRF